MKKKKTKSFEKRMLLEINFPDKDLFEHDEFYA